MTSATTVRLAAAQPLSAKARRMRQLRNDPAGRRAHFLKYNIGSSTYEPAYARAYAEDYLPYLADWVRRAADRHADLVLLPEFCFVPGVLAEPGKDIPPNPRAFADAVALYAWSGRLFADWLARMSRDTGALIGAATLTARGGKLYNTGLLADEKGRIALRYDKMHLPPDEAVHFTPGRAFDVADTRVGRVGFAICYDIQFPEHTAALAARGVQLVLHPSAGYTLPDEKRDMGRNRLRVRASDHYAALVYSSFAPVESGGPGGSCVIGPNGDTRAAVPGRRTGLAVGETAVGGTRQWPGDGPAAPDREAVRRGRRRPDRYGILSRMIGLAVWLAVGLATDARSVELGVAGSGTAMVGDPAASGGEAVALRIGDEGSGGPARWPLGAASAQPGLYTLETSLRLLLPPDFDRARLTLDLAVHGGGQVLAQQTLGALSLDPRPGVYTPVRLAFAVPAAGPLELACGWRIAETGPGKPKTFVQPVKMPTIGASAAGAARRDPPREDSFGLDDLVAGLAAEKAVPLDQIDYPAVLLDRAGLAAVADTLAVESVRPDQVHVYPGEPNPVTVTVRNFGAAPREAVLRFTMRTGLAEATEPVEARVTVPGRGTAAHRFDWTSGAREFGHEAHVELLADGRPVHAGSDCFTVSAPLWKTAIQGPGFITWYGREKDFPAHVAANRRGYINVEEAFSWQPSSWTDLNPTNAFWWSGQNNFHNSRDGLRLWMELSRAEGIKLITYMWATASGPQGAEWARRNPDLVTHQPVGLGSEFHDIEDLRLYDVTHDRPEFWRLHYGVWHSFGINRGYLRLIETGADEIIRSARRFGWGGVRFDSQLTWGAMEAGAVHAEIRDLGAERLMRQLTPEFMAITTGVWNANAVSVRNARYMKHRLREGAGPRFEIASNYGPVDTNAVTDGGGPAFDYFKAYCAGGSQVNMEHFRHSRSWTNFYLNILRQVEWTRQAGGFHAVQSIDATGMGPWRAYNNIFIFAAGSHPYIYGEDGGSPGPYARFMTRYGEFAWDPAWTPADAGAGGWTVESDPDLLWKPFLKSRPLPGGARQTALHLITPPPSDAVEAEPAAALNPWARGVRVSRRGATEPVVWRLTAEPDVTAERLTPEREGDAFVVTIPEHRVWTLLVWQEGGARP